MVQVQDEIVRVGRIWGSWIKGRERAKIQSLMDYFILLKYKNLIAFETSVMVIISLGIK